MCFNPRYIVHPTLNRILKRHNFDSVYLDGRVESNLGIIYKFLKDPASYKKLTESCPDYVRYNYYVCDSTTGETHPIFFACPCGKCNDCAASKYGELAARLQFEVLSYPAECRVIFFTLTYDNKHLPNDGVSKSDVTDFINKLHVYAKRRGLSDGFRTFVVSEYGTDPRFTHRPHYHGLIFGLDLTEYGMIKSFNKAFRSAWRRGRVDWQFARSNHGVSKYCTKYVIKGLNKLFVPDGKNPNFISYPRKSGGLGVNALKVPAIVDKIMKSTDGSITVKTHEYGEDGFCFGVSRIRIPRFIIDKLFPNFSRFIPANIRRCCIWASQIWNVLKVRGMNDDVLPPVELEKFAKYLRGFVYGSPDGLILDNVWLTPSERVYAESHMKFGMCDTDLLLKIYNIILAYLGAYKYSIDDALAAVAKRQNFMNQINVIHEIRDPRDRIGLRSSFVSKCYKDSALDAVFEL